jgi:hypothetical protein
MVTNPLKLPVLEPNLQISFYYRLQDIKQLHLQDALSAAIEHIPLRQLNAELERAPRGAITKLTGAHLRGELFFARPCVLRASPYLLGYYRLLLGFSQKEFYNKGPFGRFRRMEDKGEIPARVTDQVGALCDSLCASAARLIDGIDKPSLEVVHQLQLLTLGPQLRGQENTRIGQKATQAVYDLLLALVGPHLVEKTARTIIIKNAARRPVLLEFASDPDIRITEKMPNAVRPIVSIEVKGGGDASNIHNRLGEAEKSHQKAKGRGFFQFWTIARVCVPDAVVQRESPTTTHFFVIDDICGGGPAAREFKELFASVIGIGA